MVASLPSRLLVLLEPTPDCNLRCRHCYHAKSGYSSAKMSIETLRRFLDVTVQKYNNLHIIWHGGEPLMMGQEFFRDAYDVFGEYTKAHDTKFSFALQTNGTLLTDPLLDLFYRTKTYISISYDGEYNDALRQQTEAVRSVMRHMQDRHMSFSCISTVSSANVNKLPELYSHFKKMGVPVKLNVIIPDGAAKNCDCLVSKELWTEKFLQLFEQWFYDTDCNIEMPTCTDLLKNYLHLDNKFGCRAGVCLFGYVAVDAQGDLYPCGRMMESAFKLGNVYALDNIGEAFSSAVYRELLEKSKTRMHACSQCRWQDKCHGGCMSMAACEGDIARSSPFDCYFKRHAFSKIEELLSHYDPQKTNKYVNELL